MADQKVVVTDAQRKPWTAPAVILGTAAQNAEKGAQTTEVTIFTTFPYGPS